MCCGDLGAMVWVTVRSVRKGASRDEPGHDMSQQDTRQQLHEVPRHDWHRFFDGLTREHAGHTVTIEILDQDFGDELEAERMPLAYLEYDPKDDMVNVAVGGRTSRYPVVLRHQIVHPETISADQALPAIAWAFEVRDADGSRTFVTLFAD